MKITDVRAHALRTTDQLLQFKEEWPARRIDSVFLRVLTDEGLEGHCITWLCGIGEASDAMPKLRSVLVGRDPQDVEAISFELTDRLHFPAPMWSAADICLWDLIGKGHGLPVYKVLGAARDRIRAYASTLMYETVQEYVDLALACRAEGFNASSCTPSACPTRTSRCAGRCGRPWARRWT